MTDTTLYNTQRRFTLRKGAHKLFYCWLSSCNKGLINPKYKDIQQDITDEKERLQGYAGLRGIKAILKQESRLTFTEKLTKG